MEEEIEQADKKKRRPYDKSLHPMDLLDLVWQELRARNRENLDNLLEVIHVQEKWWDVYQDMLINIARKNNPRFGEEKRGRLRKKKEEIDDE